MNWDKLKIHAMSKVNESNPLISKQPTIQTTKSKTPAWWWLFGGDNLKAKFLNHFENMKQKEAEKEEVKI